MKNMLLVSSEWNDAQSFKMIPISKDCPYVECIYDTRVQILAVVSSIKKQIFHMVPKLDDNGDLMERKIKKAGSKNYKEERKTIETFQEFYIENPEEIKNFIEMVSINSSSFNYQEILNKKYVPSTDEAISPSLPKMEIVE